MTEMAIEKFGECLHISFQHYVSGGSGKLILSLSLSWPLTPCFTI